MKPYPDRDASDYPTASYSHHPVDDIEPLTETSQDGVDRIMDVLIYLYDCTNLPLYFDVFLWTTGILKMNSITTEQIAKKHGETKQAISKLGKKIMRELNLRPGPRMKMPAASDSYRLNNKRPLCNYSNSKSMA